MEDLNKSKKKKLLTSLMYIIEITIIFWFSVTGTFTVGYANVHRNNTPTRTASQAAQAASESGHGLNWLTKIQV